MDDFPDDCGSRMILGLGTGLAAGSVLGAVTATWGDIPVALRNKPWPALASTGRVMTQYATTMGVVALAYSSVDCAVEGLRGKKDWVNGAVGGLAAGAVLGLRVGRLPTAFGAGAAMAATSIIMELSGGKITSQSGS